MPDTRTHTNRTLRWTTTSDDCTARVKSPSGARTSTEPGADLPTTEVGIYTLSVSDHQNRTFSVTMEGDATPESCSRSDKQRVRMTYQVDP